MTMGVHRKGLALAASAALLCLLAIPGAQRAAPAEPVARAARTSTSAQPIGLLSTPCHAVETRSEASFRDAFLEGRCAYLHRGGLTFTAGSFDGPNGRMPLLFLSGRERTFSGRIIVNLIGGPGGQVLELNAPARDTPGDLFPLFENLVGDGDVIVVPAYAGTRERSFYPGADLPRATREMEAFLRQTAARFSERRLILYGQSLGGGLAARLSPQFPDVPLVLHFPLLWQPRQVIAWTERNWESPAPIRLGWVPRRIWPASGEGRPRDEMVLLFDSLQRFFGDDLDSGTVDYLRRSRAPATIIYSRRDPRIGPAEIGRLPSRSGLRVIEVDVDGHVVRTAREHDATIAALDQAFRSP